MKEIDLNDWTLFGGGMNGESYSCNNDESKVLKVFPNQIGLDAVKKEFEMADALSRKNISFPRTLEVVTISGRFGLISERINNKISFCKAAGQNPEMTASLAERLANMALTLHNTFGAEAPFTSAVEFYEDLISRTKLTPEYRTASVKALEVIRKEDCNTLIHGDFHYGNVITDGTKDYFIDLGDCRYGNPKTDIAMFFFAVHCLPDPLFQIVYHIDKDGALEFWNFFKKFYYKDDVPSDESLFKTLSPYLFFVTLGIEARCGIDDNIVTQRQRFVEAIVSD